MKAICFIFVSVSIAFSRSAVSGFTQSLKSLTQRSLPASVTIFSSRNDHTDESNWSVLSRRQALSTGIATAVSIGNIQNAESKDVYIPAKRPTAYRVDSTIPPTLIPMNAPKEIATLIALGRGSGTSKDPVLDDGVTLNNIMNKAVFGTISNIASLMGTNPDDKKRRGKGYASFVCFGIPKETTPTDIDLAVSLLTPMIQGRNSNTAAALGLAFAPMSTQSALDSYSSNGNTAALMDAMISSGVTESIVQLHLPLLNLAYSKSLNLLAMSPEYADIHTVRSEGLQNLDVDRRASYVLDSEGFISLTVDKRFRLYTERSLQKDFTLLNANDSPGGFFAEKILVHETAASVAAKYAVTRPDSFVAIIAPTPEVRYQCGINGRIPRLCEFLQKDENKVTLDAVTTILLNPTAPETLSLSRKLRLEIGTAPENIDVQTKVADYLWFSSMPKVSLIPRLMNA